VLEFIVLLDIEFDTVKLAAVIGPLELTKLAVIAPSLILA